MALLGAIICGPAAAQTPPDEALPDAGDVVGAYMKVRQWVDGFELPDPADPDALIALRDASGVCVILRQSGAIKGTGLDAVGDDLMPRRAVGRALSDVLGDPAVAGLPEDLVPEVGRALTLELEVAGPLVPLLGATYRDVADQLTPGLDGVAIRRGTETVMLFPAQMRATNTADRVERLLPSLAQELGVGALPLPDLTRRFDIALYRFRTTDLVQAAPNRPPFAVVRGEVLVDDDAVTRVGLESLALGIAQHLADTFAPVDEPVGVMGTYRPAADRFDPLVAPPLEQALAAWSLARYSRLPTVDEMTAARLAGLSERILRELRQVAAGETPPLSDAVTCAAIVHAILAHPSYAGLDPPALSEAAECVRAAYTDGSGFGSAEGVPPPPHGQALIASALCRLLVHDGAPEIDPDLARAALDAAWSAVPPHRHVALLPWIGWAESDYARATGGPLARADELTALRALLDASRVGSADSPGPADIAGGFTLSRGGRLEATAQTLRPAAFLASMVRDPRLTPPDEAAIALGRMLQTARFLMQLSVRPECTWAYRNPGRVLGGIRASTWDCDQPVAAQALGLVTVVELLESLDALAAREPGVPLGR